MTEAEVTITHPLTIVYQDDCLIAINKPEGMMTHKSRIAEDRDPSAMEVLRDQLGQWVYPIHRLDRATSGVLIFALNQEIARILHRRFAEGEVDKQYLMVTRGHAPLNVTVDRALKERKDRITDKDARSDKAPQSALTEIKTWAHVTLDIPLGRYQTSRFSLVSASPKTGRRHQIRRHLAGLNYPLIGDTTHGRGELNRLFRSRWACHRLLLAATDLTIKHPVDESKELKLQAPISGIMKQICQAFFLGMSHRDQYPICEGPTWVVDPQSLRHRLASLNA